ncbi:MAG: hypothetical protein KC476_08900 [Cyanobacteria bacterium HKST-UBA06]|nr:hypothetical protein [Cyanobacteria bacterium HKST-UBA06]
MTISISNPNGFYSFTSGYPAGQSQAFSPHSSGYFTMPAAGHAYQGLSNTVAPYNPASVHAGYATQPAYRVPFMQQAYNFVQPFFRPVQQAWNGISRGFQQAGQFVQQHPYMAAAGGAAMAGAMGACPYCGGVAAASAGMGLAAAMYNR